VPARPRRSPASARHARSWRRSRAAGAPNSAAAASGDTRGQRCSAPSPTTPSSGPPRVRVPPCRGATGAPQRPCPRWGRPSTARPAGCRRASPCRPGRPWARPGQRPALRPRARPALPRGSPTRGGTPGPRVGSRSISLVGRGSGCPWAKIICGIGAAWHGCLSVTT
jgi:hypothetical protein